MSGVSGHDNSGSTLSSQNTTYSLNEALNKVGYGRYQRILIFIAGLSWCTAAAEIIIQSVIGDILTCAWGIYTWQNALLTSGIFIGMMFGSPTFGVIADKYGRKNSVILSLALAFFFGVLSAVSPTYPYLLTFRIITGFALGGLPQLLTLVCELCPADMRGRAGFYLSYYWSAGTNGLVLVAWAFSTYPTNINWRLILAIATVPTLVALCLMKWFPESVRYLQVTGNTDQAEDLLNKVAKTNREELPDGSLEKMILTSNKSKRGNMLELLTSEHRKTILIFCYLWSATAFCYYNVVIFSPTLIQNGNFHVDPRNKTQIDVFNFTDINCKKMTKDDFINLLWTSAAEFPALLAFTFLVDLIDRKTLMAGACFISGILVLCLEIRTQHTVKLVFLFGVRGILISALQLTSIMLPESFPTTIRAVAMGSGSGFARLAGLISPYFSRILITKHSTVTVVILGLVIIIAGLTAMLLPRETRGVDLLDWNRSVLDLTKKGSAQTGGSNT